MTDRSEVTEPTRGIEDLDLDRTADSSNGEARDRGALDADGEEEVDGLLVKPITQAIEALENELKLVERKFELANKNAADAAENLALAKQNAAADEVVALAKQNAALLELVAAQDQISNLDKQIAGLDKDIALLKRDLREKMLVFKSDFHKSYRTLEKLLEEFTIFRKYGLIKVDSFATFPRYKMSANNSLSKTSSNAPPHRWSLWSFRTNHCDGTNSAFVLKEWAITNDHMLRHIQQKLCSGDGAAVTRLLSICEEAIETLRNVFAWLGPERDGDINELTHFQPIIILLVDYLIRDMRTNSSTFLEVYPVNNVSLKGTLQQPNPEVGNPDSKNVNGFSDLAVIRGPNVNPDMKWILQSVPSWLFHVELKSPFGTTAMIRAKDQLIGQSECIAQMKGGRVPVLGCLTNLKEIIISLRLPGHTSNQFDRVFYNTEIVTETRDYAIRLLFLFCDFRLEELIDLTKGSSAADKELENEAKEYASPGGEGESRAGGSEQGENGDTLLKKRYVNSSSEYTKLDYISLDDSMEEREMRRERLRKLFAWDARRRGVSYLCQESLDAVQRKLQVRLEKV